MPKTRNEKEEIIADLSKRLSSMKSAVFTSVSGYTMDDANDLRAKGREQGVELIVAKKTLLVRALEENGFKVGKDDLQGSILTSFGFNDEVSAAKMMAEYAKDRDGISLVGGILEGKFVDSAAVMQLSTLPSRDELLAKLVGTINAPISGFVNVLAGNLRALVYVLSAVKEAKS